MKKPALPSRRLQRSLERWRSGRVRAASSSGGHRALSSDDPTPLARNVEPEAQLSALRTELRSLRRLHEVICYLGASDDLETLIPEVLDLALSISGLARGVLVLARKTDTGVELGVRLVRGLSREERRSREVRLLRHLLSLACEERLPFFEPDVRRSPCADGDPGAPALALGAAVALPLEERGELVGAILLDDPKRIKSFSTTEVDLLKAYARHAAVALARAERVRRLRAKRDRALRERGELRAKLEKGERDAARLRARTPSSGRVPAVGALHTEDLAERPYLAAKRAFLRRYLRATIEHAGYDLERAAAAAGLTVAKLVTLLDLHDIARGSPARGEGTSSPAP